MKNLANLTFVQKDAKIVAMRLNMEKNNIIQQAITKVYDENPYVVAYTNNFFDSFNSNLIDDFIKLLDRGAPENSIAILQSKQRNKLFEAEYDYEMNKLKLKITEELDFITKKEYGLEFSFEKNKLQPTLLNRFYPNNIKKYLPQLIISNTTNESMEFSLLNQSHTANIIDVETLKNQKYHTFEYDLNGILAYGQKSVNQGRVVDFDIKRLKNKNFAFVTQRGFYFSPHDNYPISKEYSKRFVISHKFQDQAWLSEDSNVKRVGNMEVVEYYNNGSPVLFKKFADQKISKNNSFYIRKCPQSALDILPDFESKNIMEIDEDKALDILHNPEIGEKIYTRHKRKEFRENQLFADK